MKGRPILFTLQTKAADVALERIEAIQVFTRFNIPLGLADRTIEQVAEQNGIEPNSLLALLRVTLGQDPVVERASNAFILSVLGYLKESHRCFTSVLIPSLRKAILELEAMVSDRYGAMLSSFYDTYIADVDEHFAFEDRQVFPYIEGLLDGTAPSAFRIKNFVVGHSDIEQKLHDLKSILVKYLPVGSATEQCLSVLHLLSELEYDLETHKLIEDKILAPAVALVEKEQGRGAHV